MTDVLVCVKRVPDPTGDVVLTADGMRVDGRYAGWTTSAHEECAVELAVQVAGETGGTVTVLTLGPAEAVEQLRAALAVGADDGVLVEADPDAYGPADVAAVIADVVRERAADGAPYDLVLLGNDAADTGDFQVGIRLAHLVDRPVVAGAQTIEVAPDDGPAGSVVLRTDSGAGTEVYEVALPAVVTVLEGGVSPRYPSITGRMRARKAPVRTVQPASVPRGTGRVSLRVPPPPPTQVEVLGHGSAAAPALVELLGRLGVVSR